MDVQYLYYLLQFFEWDQVGIDPSGTDQVKFHSSP